MVRHVTKIIILQSGMLSPIPRNDWYPLERIDEFFSQIIWPVSVGRLPPSVTSSSSKADQWRLHISVLFVGLFVAWEVDGTLPDIDAPKPRSNTKNAAAQAKTEKIMRQRRLETLLSETDNPTDEQLNEVNNSTMDRSIRRHYETVLEFSTAIRILSSRSISPDEIDRGCAALSRACQNWARMGCHMTPYFHFAQHLHRQLLQFGPCYATWAFPYERNNGFLGRTNHNNHKGGELECTMMRKWWKWVLVHDLLNAFHRLPELDDNDRDSVELLESCLKGGTRPRRGTLQEYLAQFGEEGNLRRVTYPRHHKNLNLQAINPLLYGLVLRFLQNTWRDDNIIIHADVVLANEGICFMGHVTSYLHIFVEALRYGAATQPRGRSARYGYIAGRTAVEIQWIFKIELDYDRDHQLSKTVAVVRRFITSDRVPAFPWDLRAVDLGVQLIFIPITVHGSDYWVTVAHNHDGTEVDMEVTDD